MSASTGSETYLRSETWQLAVKDRREPCQRRQPSARRAAVIAGCGTPKAHPNPQPASSPGYASVFTGQNRPEIACSRTDPPDGQGQPANVEEAPEPPNPRLGTVPTTR